MDFSDGNGVKKRAGNGTNNILGNGMGNILDDGARRASRLDIITE